MGSTAAVFFLVKNLSIHVFAALLLLAIMLWIRYQREMIREELAAEADAGLISR